ncbi:hypothetical protein QBC34DRAFT_82730 [Podospora aff. communis PSN243]|uniref:Uncharacterized protein n=1 Tax=Podospora aff. communis PSN243 TaxID=3040156 RepID=A0AAV9GQ90_9PEZI|nr:hypothetical protein QBC34DRAFT_82730 [Podospora aff. communis PSN243]
MFSRTLRLPRTAALRCAHKWIPARPHHGPISKAAFSSTPPHHDDGLLTPDLVKQFLKNEKKPRRLWEPRQHRQPERRDSPSNHTSRPFERFSPRDPPKPKHPRQQPPSPDPRAVLVFSGAPTSLTFADFSRLAGQGTHLDGWAQGLDHVHRAIDPRTGDPRGLYYLFFDTAALALEYATKLITPLPQSTPECQQFPFLPPGMKPNFKVLGLDQVFTIFDNIRGRATAPPGQSTFYPHLMTLRGPKVIDERASTRPRVLITAQGGRLTVSQISEALQELLAGRVMFRPGKLSHWPKLAEMKDFDIKDVVIEWEDARGTMAPKAFEKWRTDGEWVNTRWVAAVHDVANMERLVRLVNQRVIEVDGPAGTKKKVLLKCKKLTV